jgi:hypothetical protein
MTSVLANFCTQSSSLAVRGPPTAGILPPQVCVPFSFCRKRPIAGCTVGCKYGPFEEHDDAVTAPPPFGLTPTRWVCHPVVAMSKFAADPFTSWHAPLVEQLYFMKIGIASQVPP